MVDGTAIGSGLATSVDRLKVSTAKTKVVVLLTDGENNGGLLIQEQRRKSRNRWELKCIPLVWAQKVLHQLLCKHQEVASSCSRRKSILMRNC